jgi:hypothetical protein
MYRPEHLGDVRWPGAREPHAKQSSSRAALRCADHGFARQSKTRAMRARPKWQRYQAIPLALPKQEQILSPNDFCSLTSRTSTADSRSRHRKIGRHGFFGESRAAPHRVIKRGWKPNPRPPTLRSSNVNRPSGRFRPFGHYEGLRFGVSPHASLGSTRLFSSSRISALGNSLLAAPRFKSGLASLRTARLYRAPARSCAQFKARAFAHANAAHRVALLDFRFLRGCKWFSAFAF